MRDRAPLLVLIDSGPRLNDEEMSAAFEIDTSNKFYRAIIQIIDDTMLDRMENAAKFAAENNPLGMAACNGGWDILNQLLINFEQRRTKKI